MRCSNLRSGRGHRRCGPSRLGREGYEGLGRTMKPSNAAAHPLNPKNLCFDAEGTARVLPDGELLLQSKPMLDVDAEIAEASSLWQMLTRSNGHGQWAEFKRYETTRLSS